MSTTQQILAFSFNKHRLQSIQRDINDITALYLQAQSTKNMVLIQQYETTLRKARRNQLEIAHAMREYQR